MYEEESDTDQYRGGACKCLFARLGRMGWENFLGRLEHGGWDTQMTSIMEVYEKDDTVECDR